MILVEAPAPDQIQYDNSEPRLFEFEELEESAKVDACDSIIMESPKSPLLFNKDVGAEEEKINKSMTFRRGELSPLGYQETPQPSYPDHDDNEPSFDCSFAKSSAISALLINSPKQEDVMPNKK